jgi:hypothetical protein
MLPLTYKSLRSAATIARPALLHSSAALARSKPTTLIDKPGPPPLPAAEQREFEELLRQHNAPLAASEASSDEVVAYHPDMRKGARPKFQGEKNPWTGEVGGPKTEPVAWNDWSYGGGSDLDLWFIVHRGLLGRATDF